MLSDLLPRLTGPALAAMLLLRRATGRAEAGELAERFARGMAVPGDGPLLWLHAASNGELQSARALLSGLRARRPDLRILVTTNTVTARTLAQSFGIAGLVARLAPIDAPGVLRRFLDAARPAALVIVENELWPNRLAECRRRGIPVIVVGARLSERALRRWSKLERLAARMTAAIAFLSAQDEATATRFRALGLPPDRIGPTLNLKAMLAAPAGQPAYPVPRDLTILAASTHDGEEGPVLDAFAATLRDRPGLHLILAPRHPRRRDAIEALLRQRGLAFTTRSRGEGPDPARPVYLADTMGEMDRWYAAAAITYVGGSLVPKGGHTPYEPVAHGSAVVSGTDVTNFSDAYNRLTAADGAVLVSDATALGRALASLADPARRAAITARATAALAAGDGAALDALTDRILALALA